MAFQLRLDTMIELSEGTMSVATPGNGTSRDCGTSVFECWRRRSNHERHGGKYQAVVRGDRCGVQESYRVFFATKACCVGYSGLNSWRNGSGRSWSVCRGDRECRCNTDHDGDFHYPCYR